MNPSAVQTASNIITLLASLMLVLQLLLAVQSMIATNIRLFALQSLLLAAIAAVVGYAYGAWHVYVVALLTVLFKVFFLPWRLDRLVRQIEIEQEIRPFVNMPGSMLICGALTVLAYVVARPITSLERLGSNTLAVAIALVLTGFFLMINRRKAITQVLAHPHHGKRGHARRHRPDHLRHAAHRGNRRFLRRGHRRHGPGHPGLPHPRILFLDGCQQTQPTQMVTRCS